MPPPRAAAFYIYIYIYIYICWGVLAGTLQSVRPGDGLWPLCVVAAPRHLVMPRCTLWCPYAWRAWLYLMSLSCHFRLKPGAILVTFRYPIYGQFRLLPSRGYAWNYVGDALSRTTKLPKIVGTPVNFIFLGSTEHRLLRILGTINHGCGGKNFIGQNFLPYQKFLLQKFQVWW